MVVLPAPVWPTMATVSPGSMVNETSRSTQSYSLLRLRRSSPTAASASRPCWRLRRQPAPGCDRRTTHGRTRCAPGPCGTFGIAGETISAGVSSSLKMRSLDAIADCRMLYFSLRSWMGRKKRCAYCMKATSTPSVTKPRSTWLPPNHTTQAIAIADKHFDDRVVDGVRHDRVLERVHVRAVDLLELARTTASRG